MKNQILLLAFLLLLSVPVLAQVDAICGTKTVQLLPPGFTLDYDSPESGLDTATLYIPVTLNIVGKDNGTGYFPMEKALTALCNLNTDFAPYGFHFYLEGDIRYIDNSTFYDMDDSFIFSDDMYQFIADSNTLNTLNMYIVKYLGGTTGFISWENLDWDYSKFPPPLMHFQKHAVVLTHQALSGKAHIGAHEVGHYFGLYHPFEGAKWNIFQANGTPDTVFYDIYYPQSDTTITYYWLIERVGDSSTCAIAGDLICDTPPDYLNFPYPCDTTTGLSFIVQKDPDGATFRTDATLYMSYSEPVCQNRFSPQQVQLMRTVAKGPRNYLLSNQTPPDPFPGTALNLLYPPNNATVSTPDSITLEWEEVPDADFYVFEFGRKVGFVHIPLIQDTLLNENSIKVGPLQNNITYYWKVSAANKYHPCEVLTDRNYFVALVVGVEEAALQHQLRLFPNPTSERLHWRLPEAFANDQALSVQLYNTQGRLVHQTMAPEKQWIDVAELPAGLYTLQVQAGERVFVGRVMVAR